MSKNAYSLYLEKFVAEEVYGGMITYLEGVHEQHQLRHRLPSENETVKFSF
jgi:hypothetical protein